MTHVITSAQPRSHGPDPAGTGRSYIVGLSSGELLTVICHGQLATAGSKSGYPRTGKDGKIHVAMVDGRRPGSVERAKNWRADIRIEVERVMAGRPPFDGPLEASLVITVKRPGNLPRRRKAGGRLVEVRHYPGTRPDLIKYTRLVEDAVTSGGGWKDDARVIRYRNLAKFYAGDGAAYGEPDVLSSPGIVLRVWRRP